MRTGISLHQRGESLQSKMNPLAFLDHSHGQQHRLSIPRLRSRRCKASDVYAQRYYLRVLKRYSCGEAPLSIRANARHSLGILKRPPVQPTVHARSQRLDGKRAHGREHVGLSPRSRPRERRIGFREAMDEVAFVE